MEKKKTRKLTCFFGGGTCEARKFTGPAGSDRNYHLLSRLVYFTYLVDFTTYLKGLLDYMNYMWDYNPCMLPSY